MDRPARPTARGTKPRISAAVQAAYGPRCERFVFGPVSGHGHDQLFPCWPLPLSRGLSAAATETLEGLPPTPHLCSAAPGARGAPQLSGTESLQLSLALRAPGLSPTPHAEQHLGSCLIITLCGASACPSPLQSGDGVSGEPFASIPSSLIPSNTMGSCYPRVIQSFISACAGVAAVSPMPGITHKHVRNLHERRTD